MPVVAAQTFEDGDGPQLLLDKDPGHARNADPAQDQDHQAGKAQLSLHALQYLIREVLHVAEPPYPVMSLWREIALQSFQQRLILSLARSEKTRVPHKAAEPGQPRPNRIRVVHHHARERPDIDPIARHILDHSTHCECQPPHSDLIADLEVELRHQSAGQKRAAALQHRVRVTGAACQSHLAVQRELLLNSLQYYHDGPPVRIVHRPHHRLRTHHFRVRRNERRIEVAFDYRLDLRLPWMVGPHLHVTRVHHPRLATDRSPHLLRQRAQADDGADADGDAKKEERQPPPRRAHLAPGHIEDEFHGYSSLRRGDWATGRLGDWDVTPDSPRVPVVPSLCRLRQSRNLHRREDVFVNRERRHQMDRLKYDAGLSAAQPGQCVFAHLCYVRELPRSLTNDKWKWFLFFPVMPCDPSG